MDAVKVYDTDARRSPPCSRVFDAIALFRARRDLPEGTKVKILANGARFFEEIPR
ncbi:MAG TPA: hypothetical protein VEV21_02955 [Burkholderiales bacterium]|nr:hypothetical protein [Burkholderiales bacterium]